MHNLTIPVTLVLFQFLWLNTMVFADHFPPISLRPSSCQKEKIEELSVPPISHLPRDVITVIVTRTSTDTTDCTCTETFHTETFTSGTTDITTSAITLSLTTRTPIRTSTYESVSTKSTPKPETKTSMSSTVITINNPTTITQWKSTSVTSAAISTIIQSELSELGTLTTKAPSTFSSTATSAESANTDINTSTDDTLSGGSSGLTTTDRVTSNNPITETEWITVVITNYHTATDDTLSGGSSGLTTTDTVTSNNPITETEWITVVITNYHTATDDTLSGGSSGLTTTDTVTSNNPITKTEWITIVITNYHTATEYGWILSTSSIPVAATETLAQYASTTHDTSSESTSLLRNSSTTTADLKASSSGRFEVDPGSTTVTINGWESMTERATTPVERPSVPPTTTPSKPSLSLCPSRIINPTFTPLSPLPTDYTWGCPPRSMCNPSKKTSDGECNFEAGPPADTYYCSPEECITPPKLGPPQFWGPSTSSEEIERFNATRGYINLSPLEFGLEYSIFDLDQPRWNWRRDWAAKIPGKCFPGCNNAMLEAESSGKTRELCYSDSAFLTSLVACRACINSAPVPRTSTGILPQFQQFLFYCEASANLTSTASSISITQHSSSLISLATSSTFSKAYSSAHFTSTKGKGSTTATKSSTQQTVSKYAERPKITAPKPSQFVVPSPIFTGGGSLHTAPSCSWAALVLAMLYI